MLSNESLGIAQLIEPREQSRHSGSKTGSGNSINPKIEKNWETGQRITGIDI